VIQERTSDFEKVVIDETELSERSGAGIVGMERK